MKNRRLWVSCLPLFLISATGLLIYSNSLQNSFHFDDIPWIVENSVIHDLSDVGAIWRLWPTRFITFFSLALNYHFGGLDPWGYHVFNLLAHVGCALLVWRLVRVIFRAPSLKDHPIAGQAEWIAGYAGLIFLAHPIQSQPVNYVVQRACLLAAGFYLATLYLYARAALPKDGVGRRWTKLNYAASFVTAVAAMFSKEIAVTLPFMILFYHYCFLRQSGTGLKKAFSYLPLLMIVPGVLLFSRSFDFVGMRLIREPAHFLTWWPYLLTELRVMVTYLRMLVFPAGQSVDYFYEAISSIMDLRVLFSVIVLGLVLAAAKRFFSKYRLMSFGILWFFIALLPESSIIPINDVIFEHRLYLPLVGFSLCLSSGVFYFLQNKGRRLAPVILGILVGIYCLATYQRNFVWKDELSLWMDAASKSPNNARAHNNVGLEHYYKQDLERALASFDRAIRLDPDFSYAYFNRAMIHGQRGMTEKALTDYGKAIELNDKYTGAYFGRAVAYDEQGLTDKALEGYNETIRLDPRHAGALQNRAIIYEMKGRHDKAIEDFTKAIEIDSRFTAAYSGRGVAYQSQGSLDKALEDYNKAIELSPGDADAYNNRAVLHFIKKEYDLSWQDVRKARSLGLVVKREFIEALTKVSGGEVE